MPNNKDEVLTLQDRVNEFLLKNRKMILTLVAVVAILVVALAFYFSFASKMKSDEIASVEKILFDLNKDKEDIEKKKKEAEANKKKEEENEINEIGNEEHAEKVKENNDIEKKDDEEKQDPEILKREDETIPELEKLGISSSGYASYLAFYNLADMSFSRKDYAKAKDYYLKALQALPNSYVTGVILFNVGVCLEEMKEDNAEILSYYEKASNVENFPLKPRAIFNVARLQEKMEKYDEAIATYNSLIEKYPDDDCAMIGKSRVIALGIKNK